MLATRTRSLWIGYPGAMWCACRVGLIVGMLPLFGIVAGCGERAAERSSDALAYGSGSDVEQFLEREGMTVSLVECENIRQSGHVTRALTCMTSLSREQVTALSDRFGLEAGRARSYRSGFSGHCEARLAAAPDVEVWGATWGCGPPRYGFSHLEVHLVPTTGRACISTAYNWSC